MTVPDFAVCALTRHRFYPWFSRHTKFSLKIWRIFDTAQGYLGAPGAGVMHLMAQALGLTT